MLIALHNGQRKRAEFAGSGARGKCPWTGLETKAHVGEIRQYWAYVGGAPQFVNGYEPESEWHISWKWPIQDAFCEVIFGDNNEHRADILGSDNTVIEIQHSKIDIRHSRERSRFYKEQTDRRVVWVVDIQEFWQKRFFLSEKPDSKGYYKVTWKPRRSWLLELAITLDTNLYLEFNQRSDKLLHAWVYEGEMYARFVTKENFFLRYLDAVARPECQGFSGIAKAALTGGRF